MAPAGSAESSRAAPAVDPPRVDPEVRPGPLAGAMVPGEQVRRLFRPSLAFIPLRTWKSVVLVGLVAAALHVGLRRVDPGSSAVALWTGLGVVLVRVLWSAFDRAVRAYAITDRRLLAVVGILRRTVMDLPLARVQHVIVDATLGERLLGAGSVLVSSAGGDGIDLVWLHVDRPG